MGQHKYNPTAIAAKGGKIPPKEPKPTKTEIERVFREGLDKARRDRLTKEKEAEPV